MVELNESKIVEQFQLYKQQYQAVMIQKEQMRLQQLETEKSLEELEASKNEKAYKITGPIMIKKDVEDLKKELKERQEDIDLRLKMLTKTEEKITSRLKEMEENLKKWLKLIVMRGYNARNRANNKITRGGYGR